MAQVVEIDKKRPLDEFEAIKECLEIIGRVRDEYAQLRVALYLSNYYDLDQTE